MAKSLAVFLVSVTAICSLVGMVTAADAPAPSPTSAAAAISAPIVTACFFSIAAMFVGALRH